MVSKCIAHELVMVYLVCFARALPNADFCSYPTSHHHFSKKKLLEAPGPFETLAWTALQLLDRDSKEYQAQDGGTELDGVRWRSSFWMVLFGWCEEV